MANGAMKCKQSLTTVLKFWAVSPKGIRGSKGPCQWAHAQWKQLNSVTCPLQPTCRVFQRSCVFLFSLSLRSFPGKIKVILKVEKADKKVKILLSHFCR